MLNNKRSYGYMSGIGFNKSMMKGERKREKDEKARTKEVILFHALQMP
jgi:hypothetical protein